MSAEEKQQQRSMESLAAQSKIGFSPVLHQQEVASSAGGVARHANPACSISNGGSASRVAKEEPEDTPDDEDSDGPAKKKKKKTKKSVVKKESPNDEDEEEEEEDVVTTVIGKKPLIGKVWKNVESGDFTRYRCDNYNADYRLGDAVYIESQRPEQPYYICVIQDLKMSKRDTLMVHIKWFYRTSEVPEQVYQLLIQDRHIEHVTGGVPVVHPPTRSKVDIAAMNDPMYRTRELFISEMTDIYPVSVLRGTCTVQHCLDIKAVKEFKPEENTFFYTLSYNPETRRLASTQGEIRVGASHQAKLPAFEGPAVPVEKRPEPWGEEITWSPDRIHDHDLIMFLRAARSMAAFAAMCDGGSPDDGFQAASRDGITAKAIQKLHECDYDTGKALQNLLKTPFPNHDVFRKWPEEDVKNFIKGLRIHGKNFFKIRVEFLPERDTADLIEFYYLWKKTAGAANNRPRGRRHRPSVMRRIKTGKGGANKTPKEDPNDLSSCSDVDEEEESNEANSQEEEGEMSPYYCRHCFTSTSKDWHHAGKEKLLVCTDCRIYFKRYAEYPPLDGEVKKREAEMIKKEIKEEEIITPVEEEESMKEELNISAIEKDSELEDEDLVKLEQHNSQQQEPMEMKAELPRNVRGLFSPVATLPSPHPSLSLTPGSLPSPSHSSTSSRDIQVLSDSHRPSPHRMTPTTPLAPLPVIPREPSPAPKPDGSECHRSQSAIFTRMWNRGEGNSCSRTDMIFKPVPDSKLARKREERLRKASEKEEANKMEMAKRAHQEAMAHAQQQGGGGHPMFGGNDPFRVPTPNPLHRQSFGFPPGHPLSDNRMYPPGFAPAPPPQQQNMDMERRRMEEMARVSVERQYAERMSALATDPLVRLQMAGVTPEIPGASHFAHPGFGMRGAPPGLRPPPGLDPRYRAEMFLRPGGYGFPSQAQQDFLQRQLMMEQQNALISMHQNAAQHSLMAQQEEFMMRMEHEARQRQAQQRP